MIIGSEAPVWQQLGYRADYFESVLTNMKLMSSWWNGPPALSNDVESWAFEAMGWGITAFALGSMGWAQLPDPMSDWREAGRRLIAASTHYFFGNWRDSFEYLTKKLNRSQSRLELKWSDYYREGLAVALSLRDFQSTDRLLEWPGPDLRPDEGTDNRTAEDNAYQIWLASRLLGKPESTVEEQRVAIEMSKRRRPKLLLEAANSLLANDKQGMIKPLVAYLRHYRKQDIRPNRIDFGICLDATVLWHLALRRGMGQIELPSDVMILIARP